MKTVTCFDCGKSVRDKPLLGTLHLCLNERAAAMRRLEIERQRRARRLSSAGVGLSRYNPSRYAGLALAVLLPLLFAAPAHAQVSTCPGMTIPLSPLPGLSQQITVSTSSIGFTAGNITSANQGNAVLAVVSVQSAAIRYRDDGLAPTSSVGHPVAADTVIVVCGRAAVLGFRAIRSGGSDATLDVSYYRFAQ
ncbi:hypothetical protein [Longimicrobium sp.]|uniref:hypothetical protein n=1 Tax=Longimicrobium sp. TaxID=2029185 RepID=UPI002E37C3D7|nr:hypothetical protein [Longimicrobium sp.]HEX6038902.1 hypothetical protein [Longimicrobium sp.]